MLAITRPRTPPPSIVYTIVEAASDRLRWCNNPNGTRPIFRRWRVISTLGYRVFQGGSVVATHTRSPRGRHQLGCFVWYLLTNCCGFIIIMIIIVMNNSSQQNDSIHAWRHSSGLPSLLKNRPLFLYNPQVSTAANSCLSRCYFAKVVISRMGANQDRNDLVDVCTKMRGHSRRLVPYLRMTALASFQDCFSPFAAAGTACRIPALLEALVLVRPVPCVTCLISFNIQSRKIGTS